MSGGPKTFSHWADYTSRGDLENAVMEKLGGKICALEDAQALLRFQSDEILLAIEASGSQNPKEIAAWIGDRGTLRSWSAPKGKSGLFRFCPFFCRTLPGFCTHEEARMLSEFTRRQILAGMRDSKLTNPGELAFWLTVEKKWSSKGSRLNSDNVLVAVFGSHLAEDEVRTAAEEVVRTWLLIGPGLTEKLLVELLKRIQAVRTAAADAAAATSLAASGNFSAGAV